MERIPLPEEKARDRRPIHVEFQPRAMPGQRFAVRLDWNSYLGKWIIEIEHTNVGRRITKSTATAYRPYGYLPNLVFYFADASGEQTEITPMNLGDEIQLFVVAGPSGRATGGG